MKKNPSKIPKLPTSDFDFDDMMIEFNELKGSVTLYNGFQKYSDGFLFFYNPVTLQKKNPLLDDRVLPVKREHHPARGACENCMQNCSSRLVSSRLGEQKENKRSGGKPFSKRARSTARHVAGRRRSQGLV